jgi:hypothetical protein
MGTMNTKAEIALRGFEQRLDKFLELCAELEDRGVRLRS